MTAVEIITTVTVILGLSSGVLVLLSDPKDIIKRYYFYLTLGMVGFAITNILTKDVSISHELRDAILRANFSFAILSAIVFFLFSWKFSRRGDLLKVRVQRWVALFVPILFFFLVILSGFSNMYIANIYYDSEDLQLFTTTAFDLTYLLCIVVPILSGLFLIFSDYRFSETKEEKSRNGLFLLGSIITGVVTIIVLLVQRYFIINGLVSFFVVDTLPAISRYSFIIFFLFTTYAILRYRLFGIRVILGKLILWLGIAVFFLTGFYSVLWLEQKAIQDIFSPVGIFLNSVVAIILAVLFSLYEKQLEERIYNTIIYAKFDPGQVVELLAQRLRLDSELQTQVAALFQTFERTIRTSKMFVMVIPKSTEAVEPISVAINFTSDEQGKIETGEVINSLLENVDPSINLSKGFPQLEESVSQSLVSVGIDAIYCEETDKGYVIVLLGNKKGGSSYTREEIDFANNMVQVVAPLLAYRT